MNKKLRNAALLSFVGILAACGGKIKGLTKEEVMEIVESVEEFAVLVDSEVTRANQSNKKGLMIEEAVFTGYESEFEAANGATTKSYSVVTDEVSDQKKYNNQVLIVEGTKYSYNYYDQDNKTVLETSLRQIFKGTVDGKDVYYNVEWYGEDDPFNFAYYMDEEFLEFVYDYTSIDEFFDSIGYGYNTYAFDEVGMYDDNDSYTVTYGGKKNSDGSCRVEYYAKADIKTSDIVELEGFDYDPVVKKTFYVTADIDAEGLVTNNVIGVDYYLTASPIDGKAFKQPVYMAFTSLTTSGMSKEDNGNYEGTLHYLDDAVDFGAF